MSTVPTKQTVYDVAKAMLPTQYRNKTNWDKLLKVIAKPFQDLEDAFIQLLDERYVSVATGVTQDQLGEILDEPRAGRADAQYLIRLKAKVLLILSSGTQPQILALLDALKIAGTKEYTPYYPAAFTVHLVGSGSATPVADAEELGAAVAKAKAAGVAGAVIISAAEPGDTFMWTSGSALVSNANQGWGSSADPEVGGVWAGAY